MLSVLLRNLRRELRKRAPAGAGRGLHLTAGEVDMVAALLIDAEAQAATLERQPVPPPCREPLPPGVVDLAARRTRGTALAARPDGGAA